MNDKVTPGGGFLLSLVPNEGIFSREKFNEDQLEFRKTAMQFDDTKVKPKLHELETKAKEGDEPIAVKLFKQIGELGLLGIEIPEEYDGLGLDLATQMAVIDCASMCLGFYATVGAHTGLGTEPILFFGNEEQKKKYLPKLATGELLSCYALTEPGSGSDALSGKTIAVLNDEKTHYIITGEKQFITNAGWADIAIVFAQVDGKYSAFIVDLHSEGVSRGAEEKKMGIKGSSTTNLIFNKVKVPKENILGNIGDASSIALNILNIGRLKLGVVTIGIAKQAINWTISYGLQRKQFGQPIITFDLQKRKLADAVARLFATDSLVFRTVGAVNEAIEGVQKDENYRENMFRAIRGYALEAALSKVEGSEMLFDVATECVKMHGGYGYVEEYHVERILRDCVINMIFEGTNDINRLTSFDSLVRNIFGAVIPFREFMEKIDKAIREKKYPFKISDKKGVLEEEKFRVMAAKSLVAYIINRVLIRFGKDIRINQQAMEAVSDLITAIYAADSTLARVSQLENAGNDKNSSLRIAVAKLVTEDKLEKVLSLSHTLLISASLETEREKRLEEIEFLAAPITKACVDKFKLRREIAEAIIEAGQYPL